MSGDIVITVTNPDDIVAARQAGHELASDLGFSLTDVTMITTAISEVARNITSYAGCGTIRVTVEDREGRKALVVHAEDDGPGIVDVERALEDGYSTGRGLGLGLPGARHPDGPHLGGSDRRTICRIEEVPLAVEADLCIHGDGYPR